MNWDCFFACLLSLYAEKLSGHDGNRAFLPCCPIDCTDNMGATSLIVKENHPIQSGKNWQVVVERTDRIVEG